jgi:hypothetical protein
MGESSPLPDRLRYLEPVRKQFARLAAQDNLHEDTDLSVLRRVVRRRLKGLSSEESRMAMAQDGGELEQWLATSEAQHEPLHFLLPILPEAIDVLFAEPRHEPPERGIVRMELPTGARVTEENGSWSVKWRRKWLFLYPSHREEMHSEAGRLRDEAKNQPMTGNDGMSVTEVRFGPVAGIKRVYKGPAPRFKRVDYALDVPGGHVTATQDSASKAGDFDEQELEACFHTMQILNYPPTTTEASREA